MRTTEHFFHGNHDVQVGATPSSGVAGVLNKMDSRWKNWWIRGIFSFVMVGGFSLIIYLGPITLSLLVLAILLKCFQEIISIGYSKYKEYNLPLYRVLNWSVDSTCHSVALRRSLPLFLILSLRVCTL